MYVIRLQRYENLEDIVMAVVIDEGELVEVPDEALTLLPIETKKLGVDVCGLYDDEEAGDGWDDLTEVDLRCATTVAARTPAPAQHAVSLPMHMVLGKSNEELMELLAPPLPNG